MFYHFRYEYDISRNHKVICHLINDSNKNFICQEDIWRSEEGPYLTYAECELRRDSVNMLTKLSLMTTKKEVVQDLESSPDFRNSVVDAFTEINCQIGARYKGK
jgi:hypothetical protein